MPLLRTACLWIAAALMTGAGTPLSTLIVQSTSATPARARTALIRELPRLDGSKLVATLAEVTYDPGGANPAHRHPCPVVGYVLEGQLRMQLKGQPERVFGPGESFYESPDDVHVVSANARADRPARFLAYFVCDRATPLSMPLAGDGQ